MYTASSFEGGGEYEKKYIPNVWHVHYMYVYVMCKKKTVYSVTVVVELWEYSNGFIYFPVKR